ncbi:solute carrier family 25 protein [Legionella maioricensis]|uniref:MC/SLC25 family protein n=1 Tax=Legionella maioricensis TaxID=2896528 RepID=A0A9X2D174_9GAMM|nr:solute carrier family 25 protein [Legionella maioricensis]MCL9684437.1 MC/SLC25 family protein [Legionella maioricensis]MCL9687618.1 MC/SLC25 family protein [Legionella maioricensis]
MKDKTDKSEFYFWQQVAQLPFVQGPLLGASVMTMVTPLLNWTNHVMNDKPMVWRNAMSGSVEYASSAIPSYATVFAIKKMLQPTSNRSSPLYDFFSSFAAGAFSGLASTPFDAIAQNRQLAEIPSSKQTGQKMITLNGYSSLFQGGTATMLREGIWSTVYLTAVPILTQHFCAKGMKKEQAEGLALILTAGSYGMFSTPLNQLRSRKQKGLTEPLEIKSYLQHVQDIWNQKPTANTLQRCAFFFKGAIPRTVTTTVAGGLLVKGQELYNEVVASSKP